MPNLIEGKKCLLDVLQDVDPKATLDGFSKLSGLTLMTLYSISNGTNTNPGAKTMETIFKTSKKYYGRGVKPNQYIEGITF